MSTTAEPDVLIKQTVAIRKKIRNQIKILSVVSDVSVPALYEQALIYFLEAKGIFLDENLDVIQKSTNGITQNGQHP
jgi:hypothetical protein